MLELTKDELDTTHKQQLEQLVENAGGINHLSKMLNLHYTTVRGWVDRGRISKEGAILVESHGSLGEYHKAKDLRPDM